uniref:LINE-1 reverse transcriptase isogeny n=1 Tax=Cajanus cajan TaxID=3821 RepID=A0A151UB28_CAJCA|nr:hypothetical protein KK1_020773 [Cajanus cajan]
MSSLEKDLEGLIIKDGDDGGTSNLVNLSLVGHFPTNRPIHTHIMKNRMASIWRPGKGVSISELKPGVFLFQFYHHLDLKHVLDNGLWNFENNILIESKIFEGDIPKDIPLNHVDVWVQVHNLPAGFMSQNIGEHLGNSLANFLDYDSKHNTSLWKLCIRISPLQKDKKIKKQGGEWKTVTFKYEKIGQFCYLCGILGHNDKFCPKLFEQEDDDGIRLWGLELREIHLVTDTLGCKISQLDNEQLTTPLSKDEIPTALFQMLKDKALRPDGFNPGFYKSFWEVCGEDILSSCNSWLKVGELPPHINDVVIALIPKCLNPSNMKELRPISLCNVIYKILPKALANRLKPLLQNWMMMCITSVHFQVLLNGNRVGSIIPGRGLRQGDPYSPYLFILSMKGLSSLIHKVELLGNLKGIQICHGAPKMHHLMFADDVFLFFQATEKETNKVASILKT